MPEPDRPPPLTLLDRARGVVAAGATPARAGPCDGRCGCCGGLELELVLPPPPGGGEVGRRLSAPAAGDGRSCGPGIAQNDRLEGDKGRVQWRSTRSGSGGLTRRVGGGGSSRALFSAPLSPGLSPASGPCPPLAFAVNRGHALQRAEAHDLLCPMKPVTAGCSSSEARQASRLEVRAARAPDLQCIC